MKRISLLAVLLAALTTGGPTSAQTAAPAPVPTLGQEPQGAGPMGPGRMQGRGMGGPGMMGRGMGGGMGMGMGMGMCPMMTDAAEHVTVKNTDDGATITLTSSDPAAVKRIQKMAEAMRLMHEAATQ